VGLGISLVQKKNNNTDIFILKSAGAKKKQLHIEKADDDFIPVRGGGYDDPDEYDFM
jgi:hypothetical protein